MGFFPWTTKGKRLNPAANIPRTATAERPSFSNRQVTDCAYVDGMTTNMSRKGQVPDYVGIARETCDEPEIYRKTKRQADIPIVVYRVQPNRTESPVERDR
ncbi:uncharacterized protein Z519_08005 [Cladophialophora bantiana CBS 173.52]|uniref:Uncharacterized protein n=1 Tax=Cladophialophora bantiana (strain ATCC 10958 / CBS 173.52 / CDC B-1940 / NIH 8579) TaxID=1442370 RepID=A0A0D2EM79_CLAB1|nr:uncharacterized protein Z519_08005 [Cladophialophora bantiana CBS 173.52]KIW91111.1 hypothetical protein Z519_08005 [Cladophialophora bantiana CBS 173.52]